MHFDRSLSFPLELLEESNEDHTKAKYRYPEQEIALFEDCEYTSFVEN